MLANRIKISLKKEPENTGPTTKHRCITKNTNFYYEFRILILLPHRSDFNIKTSFKENYRYPTSREEFLFFIKRGVFASAGMMVAMVGDGYHGI